MRCRRLISKLFGSYGQEFQALTAQAGLFHSSFVQSLTSGGNLYAAARGGRRVVAAITDVGGAPFSPWLLLTGRALFGNGVNGASGAAGTGAAGGNGGAGGLIWGNGGNGGNGGSGVNGAAASAAPAAVGGGGRRQWWRWRAAVQPRR